MITCWHKQWGWFLGYTLDNMHGFKLCLCVTRDSSSDVISVNKGQKSDEICQLLIIWNRAFQIAVQSLSCTDAPDIWQLCRCPQTCSLEDYRMQAGPKNASQIWLH